MDCRSFFGACRSFFGVCLRVTGQFLGSMGHMSDFGVYLWITGLFLESVYGLQAKFCVLSMDQMSILSRSMDYKSIFWGLFMSCRSILGHAYGL